MEAEGGERASIIVGLIENRAKEVGLAAFDLRSASLHLSQYIETSSSYHNTKTLLHFYDPAVIIVPPNRTSADGMAGVSEQVDRFYSSANKGATLTKSLAAKELSVGLDIYCKQYYLCLGSVAAIIRCYTIFATHMEKLTELVTLYPNVKVLHFQVNVNNGRLDFKFRLMDGTHDVPYYGLLLAGVAGLPNSVIEVARNITTKIMKKEALRMEENCIQYHPIWLDYRLLQRLICLKYSNQGEDGILTALQNLKESYINGKLSG